MLARNGRNGQRETQIKRFDFRSNKEIFTGTRSYGVVAGIVSGCTVSEEDARYAFSDHSVATLYSCYASA